MEIVGIILGVLGIIGSIYYGIQSKRVENAFAEYVALEKEVKRLRNSSKNFTEKVNELEELKAKVYRHYHKPKSTNFAPGDKVRLVKIPQNRGWITEHSKIGMNGIVVDYGPGTYEFTVYWSEADYEGQPIEGGVDNWKTFYVTSDHIERIG